MLSIAKRTAVGAGLLLIMPVAVWVSGWSWQPGYNVWWLKSLYWVTETVTQPWGIITHVVLCAWFLWCLRFRLKAAVMLFAILAVAILVGQGVKSWVKDRVQEPRPFVVWLEKTHHIPVDEFYTLKRKDRGNLVKDQLAEQQ
ncbi:TPA: phosphatidylglycerophosphatase B, partial [Citrobacter freundii]|nr:phosphatidylglycerophosphatase B [Citrobacter freundii]HCA0978881.1 phosphatidylglycerophosphatase B [Citrobacter freundii]